MRFPIGLLAPYDDPADWPSQHGLLSPASRMVLTDAPAPASAPQSGLLADGSGLSDPRAMGLLALGTPDYTLGSRGLNDNNNGLGMTEIGVGGFGPMSARTARLAGGGTETALTPAQLTSAPLAFAQSPAATPRVPEMLTQGDERNSPFSPPQAPAPTAQPMRVPEVLAQVDDRNLPAGFGRVGPKDQTTALEGSPEHKAFLADRPAQGATPAGPAPFNGPQKDEPGVLDKLSTVLGGVYGAGGPGDGLINLGLALMSPGNKAENVMKVGQMAQANEYRRSQMQAAQMKQQREAVALRGNVEILRKAFPGYSDEQLFGMAQQPALVQEAIKRVSPNETFRTLSTPEERAQFGIRPDFAGTVQVDQAGKLHFPDKPTTQVSVDTRGENSFSQTAGSEQAKRFSGYIAGADKAQGALSDINNLREMSRRIGSPGATADFKRMIGPYAEAAGVSLDGLSDIQAYESVIQKLAPQMRVEGSGATSDLEFKGMLAALPRLSSNPAAREAILNTMEAQQRHALAQGDIATQVFNGEMTRQEGEKLLRALPDPMTAFREFRKSNPDAFGHPPAANGNAPGATQAAPRAQYSPAEIEAELLRRGIRK